MVEFARGLTSRKMAEEGQCLVSKGPKTKRISDGGRSTRDGPRIIRLDKPEVAVEASGAGVPFLPNW